MRPLIAIASVPFKHCYSEIELKAMEREELEYFWLLARLTEKIISGVRAAGGVPALLSAADGSGKAWKPPPKPKAASSRRYSSRRRNLRSACSGTPSA